MSNQYRKPKGAPNSAGGQYTNAPDRMMGALPDLDDPTAMTLAAMSATMRAQAVREPHPYRSAQETRAFLDEAATIRMDRDGLILEDRAGNLLFHETGDTARLDIATLRADPRVRRLVRDTLRTPTDGVSALEQRRMVKTAWRLASPYERKRTIDQSPMRRYAPANSVANSLRHRRDQEEALRILKELHYEDAAAVSNVIRNGYPGPDNPKVAWAYINYTSVERYAKDVVDRETGQIVHHKGDAVREMRMVNKMKPGGGYELDEHGRHVKVARMVNKPASKGAAPRSYLRMLYQPTKGVPDEKTARSMARAFRMLDDDPQAQAEAFWTVCYGEGSVANPSGSLDTAKQLLGRHAGGRQAVAAMEHAGGQGNTARMIAYQRALTPQAARIFLDMEPGDGRLANTTRTHRVRSKETGRMEDRLPKRLSEMRSFIHAVYEI